MQQDWQHESLWPDKSARLKLFGSIPSVPGEKPIEAEGMQDLQNSHHNFLFALDQVGIGNLRYPLIVLSTLSPSKMTTTARFHLTTSLSQQSRGINMSRLTEQLELARQHGLSDRFEDLSTLTRSLAQHMQQEQAKLVVEYDWYYERQAPRSGHIGLNHAVARLELSYSTDHSLHVKATLEVQITTLCPCSRDISEYSAHNQRGRITMEITPKHGLLPDNWKERLLEVAESNASSIPYPVLKRPDEKYITEQAYENARFVEDILRLNAADLYESEWIESFTIHCRNEESIHQHDAIGSVSYCRE
ncbi:GTP cyclohydrolase FolE2 [Paenibacillus hunanensis]|uniref:GTP cyclohydrolase I n=1 Tax=Paenibacillus hunanensis TaxID=539262 RepID=A0ABU1J1W0_9BACL|nr:GTP cyclohydrolase FolE2 [Paenibacillus hunanensis]MDR6245389.1 GTP cyclohydrolase I [Paenibacillus hunanensis]GGJ27250.1 GTP cyclohydrolase FolE2 [Paenibacillus hunanensis]